MTDIGREDFYHDHYCTPSDPPCPDRVPAEQTWQLDYDLVPDDAAAQCLTCRWAPRCFGAEFGAGLDNEPEFIWPAGVDPEEAERAAWDAEHHAPWSD